MPSDLIYREDAKDYVRYAFAKGLNALEYLDEVPAANFQPVVRGRWVKFETDTPPRRNVCSECRYITNPWLARVYNFCPNCGADMREPPKEE